MDWKKMEDSIYKKAKERLQWWKRVFTTGADLLGYLLGGAIYTLLIGGFVFVMSEGVLITPRSNKLVYVLDKETKMMMPVLKCVYGRVFGNQRNAYYSMGTWEPHDKSKILENAYEILIGFPLDDPVILRHNRVECPETFLGSGGETK